MRIKSNGIFGLVAIGIMFFIASEKKWDIPWGYFVIGTILYSIILIALTNDYSRKSSGDPRLILGSHLAYLLLAGGMTLGYTDFWVNFGIFLAAITAGFAITFMLLDRSSK